MQIGDAGAESLFRVLPEMKFLSGSTYLLDRNQIGDAGAQALAKVLPDLPKYENTPRANLGRGPRSPGLSLHLIDNQIGDAGAKAVKEAVVKTSGLKIYLVPARYF
eukprot:gnl/TRDRNA2_/TRDRNA2_176369_c0_seq1.p1 gnl/TRDRNA2_/TRDRNA2_176369_c0~~gnl/TRDRNA2_/TRDRNA2_176369_c0_seq1.p1  ORF type:complete len:106 (-),score=3.98 gnl/TRDRNA2_/TRDRNA2_176369_c0_seq1:63-380(-)